MDLPAPAASLPRSMIAAEGRLTALCSLFGV